MIEFNEYVQNTCSAVAPGKEKIMIKKMKDPVGGNKIETDIN